MKRNRKIKMKKNPFRNSFLSVAVICCLALSVLFFYISYMNNKATQTSHERAKAELSMADLEAQLEIMEDISLRIASNYEFHPYYFKKNVARELSMLENFEQYRYYTALTEEYFLYYGGDRIYRSSGSTFDLELFMLTKSEDEDEWERFHNELREMREELTEIRDGMKVISIFDEIYVLIPLKVNEGEGRTKAVLGFVIKESALGERFRVVSGALEGDIALYGEEGLLYADGEKVSTEIEKDMITVSSTNGLYTICYLPKKEYSMQSGLFWLQFLLVAADVLLVLIVANIFANKAYSPILGLAERYRRNSAELAGQYEDAVEELGFMLDHLVQSNEEVGRQILQRQSMLRDQVLRMLVEGRGTFDMRPYLDKLEIVLPGPFFCVISIAFEDEITEHFLYRLQKELEQIAEEKEAEYIYTISSYPKKLINVICSIQTEEAMKELEEIICEVAEGFGYQPVIGVGNTYRSLSNLSASWLESMDEIHSCRHRKKNETKQGFIYDSEMLHRVYAALENGNEKEAMERLNNYIEKLNKMPMSLLMQQYIAADFMGEIGKLGKKHRLELSKQNVSLLLSARNIQDFGTAAQNVIRDFCKDYESMKNQIQEEESLEIYEYINEHFAEYDMSQEKVAADLNTTTSAVRQAVLTHTGKMYKDYIVSLRIEYAKELLGQENLQVAEVCERVGYGNISYFIRLFREVTGVTPAKYRRDVMEK